MSSEAAQAPEPRSTPWSTPSHRRPRSGAADLGRPSADLGRLSACDGWTVADALAHLTRSLHCVATALARGAVPPVASPWTGPVTARSLRRDLGRAAAALGAAADLRGRRAVAVDGLPLPCHQLIVVGAIEAAVHGWDARPARPIPDDLAGLLLPELPSVLGHGIRRGLFADPVALPPAALPASGCSPPSAGMIDDVHDERGACGVFRGAAAGRVRLAAPGAGRALLPDDDRGRPRHQRAGGEEPPAAGPRPARRTGPGRPGPEPDERALLDRYIAAFEAEDTAALRAVVQDDFSLEAVPYPVWFRGVDVCLPFLERAFAAPGGAARLLPTRANGQPAAASYRRGRADGLWVFTVSGGRFSRAVKFHDPRLVAAAGLPDRLEV
ncbi:maleylpyruvate isomerase N-terminal domain-containing protein [Streptomyces sp. MN03-5084-2B]|nr:maleylpyruvate isomerase N-terminal domain-containing protein [Streptomyces sp. MN03-5084-2B]